VSKVLVQEREIGRIALKAVEKSLLLLNERFCVGKRGVRFDGGREGLGLVEDDCLRDFFLCIILLLLMGFECLM
jgi:hypothetical protein